MKESYLRYYERHTPAALARFLWDSWWAPSRVEGIALANRLRDYPSLGGDPRRLALHRELNRLLLDEVEGWESHRYGAGYFYQGCPEVGVTGLRDTAARLESMGLPGRVAGMRVLEIGCNSGFLSVALAREAREVVGFDINPFQVEAGRKVAAWLGRENVRLEVSSFEELAVEGEFDAVLSFANHSTYDGNIRLGLAEFFDRCRDRVRPGGTFLFESHPPAHEGGRLGEVLECLRQRFRVEEERVLARGTFMDRDRTFVAAVRP